ncbi:hypothetical protein Pmani_025706 [Petrolisthes manimaculis]|uniref:Uncharacterized protein n=1 Tax=Petrolisthes manimaculis TaxID=1843537 RepID=A0AAE1U0X8_9EUCA|nr:hypothetical protein Pmani_025706 [Petrolisthes manimaculis]
MREHKRKVKGTQKRSGKAMRGLEPPQNRPLPLSEPTTLDLQSHPPLPSKPSPSPFKAIPFSLQSHPLLPSKPSPSPFKAIPFSLQSHPPLPSKPSPSPFKAIPFSLQSHPLLPSKPSPSPFKAVPFSFQSHPLLPLSYQFIFPSKDIPVSFHLASDTGNSNSNLSTQLTFISPSSPHTSSHLYTSYLHPPVHPRPPPTCTPETSTHLYTRDLHPPVHPRPPPTCTPETSRCGL